MLMIRCPKTGEPLWTGSDASLEEPVSGVVGPCPHCGEAHAWSNKDVTPTWLLACGHSIPLLEHERPEEPPERPRMCPICGKLREIVVES